MESRGNGLFCLAFLCPVFFNDPGCATSCAWEVTRVLLRRSFHLPILLAVFACLVFAAPSLGADISQRVLRKGDRIAIAGDSITEQHLYSMYVETYLLACVPELKARVMLNGWAGENTTRFLWRMDDVLEWKPDVLTVCYGMNDGCYLPYAPWIGETYRKNLEQIVNNMDQYGGLTLIASPGVVDTESFRIPSVSAAAYNDNLGELAKIACQVAEKHHLPYAEIHAPMLDVMTKAKEAYGPAYLVAGTDGIHPGPNGQLVMAWRMLRAMGFDGKIMTITLDWNGEATVSEGHEILKRAGGKLEMESRRWPFCFFGQKDDPNSILTILRFVPFQAELNRFNIEVKNLPTSKANVYFGEYCKTFDREDLASGVNLANEFLINPFSPGFEKLNAITSEKQAYEAAMVKSGTAGLRFMKETMFEKDKGYDRANKTIREKLLKIQASYMDKAADAVKPVRYTVEVVPIGE